MVRYVDRSVAPLGEGKTSTICMYVRISHWSLHFDLIEEFACQKV